MRKHVVLFLVSALLLCGAGGWYIQESLAASASRSELYELLEKPEKSARLMPDVRALRAVSEISCLVAGQPLQVPTAEFSEGKWRISHGQRLVGEVSEYPDFAELRELTTSWASMLLKESPSTPSNGSTSETLAEMRKEAGRFYPDHCLETAALAGELWSQGVREPEVMELAARALGNLSLQTVDKMETADVIAARALAALAVASALKQERLHHEECVLAFAMGYAPEAWRMVAALPEDDPIRAFIRRDDATLAKLATKSASRTEAHYLILRRLSEKEESAEKWLEWQQERMPSAPSATRSILGLAASRADFALNETMGNLIVLEVLAAMEKNRPPTLRGLLGQTISFGKIAERFETALSRIDAPTSAPLADQELVTAWHRAALYTGLELLGTHYLEQLASVKATQEYSKFLGSGGEGALSDFQTWFWLLSESKQGRGSFDSLLKGMQGLRTLGGSPLDRLHEAIYIGKAPLEPPMVQATHTFIRRLDTRIEHRFLLMRAAQRQLHDLRLVEKVGSSCLATTSPYFIKTQLWYADFLGESTRTTELAADKTLLPGEAKAIRDTMNQHASLKPVQAMKLLDENPLPPWSALAAQAEKMYKEKQYEELLAFCKGYLQRAGEHEGFPYIEARVWKSLALMQLGRLEEGLYEVETVVDSHTMSALATKARLLSRLGRAEEAAEWAAKAYERYPFDFYSVLVRVEVAWRAGHYQRAAELIKTWPYPKSGRNWGWDLGSKHTETFPPGKEREGSLAVEALLKADFGRPFTNTAQYFENIGRHDLAFEILSRLRSPSAGEMAQNVVVAARALRNWKGEKASADWVKRVVPAQAMEYLAIFAFNRGEYNLLWDVTEPGETGVDYLWLTRAAASAEIGSEDPHRKELLQHFNGSFGKHYYQTGRFLLGLISEKQMAGSADTPKKRCEIAFFVGWKAQTEGRYADAAAWYQACISTGLRSNAEYHMAAQQLSSWASKSITIDRIAQLPSHERRIWLEEAQEKPSRPSLP